MDAAVLHEMWREDRVRHEQAVAFYRKARPGDWTKVQAQICYLPGRPECIRSRYVVFRAMELSAIRLGISACRYLWARIAGLLRRASALRHVLQGGVVQPNQIRTNGGLVMDAMGA